MKSYDRSKWEKVRLGDICSVTTGKLDANAMHPYGKYAFFTCAKEVYKINNYAFDTEALLISGNGSHVGYVHYYKGKFNAYQRTYVLDNFSVNIIFIKHLLDNKLAKRINIEKKSGNTPYILRNTLCDMEILKPVSTDEQFAIVDALQCVDSCISNLEKLISKQENIKKSTIKLLLQPKDNWNKVKLGDVSNMFSGGTPAVDNKSFYNNGNIPFIRSGEIAARQTELHITENALNNSSAKMVQRGDLLFALYGATSGNVAISNIAGAINQAILCIRSQIIVPNFLYHLLKHKQKYIISTFLQGGQGNLSAEIIKALTIRIPSVSEQTKIADTLSEIDAYIETLKQQLKKQQNLKQGLMEYFFGD